MLQMGCIENDWAVYTWLGIARHHNDTSPEMAPAPILSRHLSSITWETHCSNAQLAHDTIISLRRQNDITTLI